MEVPKKRRASRRPPTMRDVARLAEVSVQTVSRVVNGEGGISSETLQRVQAAIEALGYQPHGIARSLRTRRTDTVALLVPHVSRPFFAQMTSAVEQEAMERGYSLVVYSTRDDPSREAKYLDLIVRNWVDGVLYVTTDYFNNLNILAKAGIPAVAMDRHPIGYEGPAVLFDNYRSGQMAAEHLLGLGHRRIAFIESASPRIFSRQQLEGLMNVLSPAGAELVRPELAPTDRGAWRGYRAMQVMAERMRLPTAVITIDDYSALGILRFALEHGLRVPQDLSILAINDGEYMPFTKPSITAIVQPIEEMVQRAFEILQALMNNQDPPEPQVVLAPSLIRRESTGAPERP